MAYPWEMSPGFPLVRWFGVSRAILGMMVKRVTPDKFMKTLYCVFRTQNFICCMEVLVTDSLYTSFMVCTN